MAVSTRNAEVLLRLEPFEREPLEVPIHGSNELPRPRRAFVPPSYIARLRRALVAGANSAVVFGNGRLVIPGPDQLLELRPLLFDEFLESEGEWRFLRGNPLLRADRRLRVGVLVTNRFSHNYFHFLVEALQAVCLAERVVDPAWPLVVDARISRQARELLELVAPRRTVVEIPPDEFWRVEDLYLSVLGTYAPDSADLAPLASYETRHLSEVRRRVVEAVGTAPNEAASEILYVSRRKYLAENIGQPYVQFRDVVNSLELEEYLTSLGGRVIHPEQLSAAEQVRAFRAAKVVIAPAGSAVANVVFCEPGTACITLHQNRLVNPWYFAALAEELELDWHFALGKAVEGHWHPLHASYSIPLETLQSALEAVATGTRR